LARDTSRAIFYDPTIRGVKNAGEANGGMQEKPRSGEKLRTSPL
jgi:hypothetical protein